MRETSATPLVTWSRTFPATPEQACQARRFLAVILDGRPDTDDAVLCLSELVTNATVHSNSRLPDGRITVRVQLHGLRLAGISHRPRRPRGPHSPATQRPRTGAG